MNWYQEWQALSARIHGLPGAGKFFYSALGATAKSRRALCRGFGFKKMNKVIIPLLVLVLFFPMISIGNNIAAVIKAPDGGRSFFPKESIAMEVAFDYEFKDRKKEKDEFNVVIYCKWTNISKGKTFILLKNHDRYHGTLDYPWGLEVKVTDSSKIITDWWASSNISSQISEMMPGDFIELKPNESVYRSAVLKDVLMGLSDMKDWNGIYKIEVRLGDIISKNHLTLRVRK